MRRSLQEYVELVVFGLIALLVGTGLLWVGGWVLSLIGIVLKGLAGLLWMLLRFIVPVAIAGGLVYFLVKAAQGRQRSDAAGAGASGTRVPTQPSYSPPATSAASGDTQATAPGAYAPATSGAAVAGGVADADVADAAMFDSGTADGPVPADGAVEVDTFDAPDTGGVTNGDVALDPSRQPLATGAEMADDVAADVAADFDEDSATMVDSSAPADLDEELADEDDDRDQA